MDGTTISIVVISKTFIGATGLVNQPQGQSVFQESQQSAGGPPLMLQQALDSSFTLHVAWTQYVVGKRSSREQIITSPPYQLRSF